jgi:Putative Ig domain
MIPVLHRLRSVLSACAVLLLLGCKGGGGDSNSAASSAPAASSLGTSAPTIGGSAGTSAQPNLTYSFKPTATDADGDAVTFQIQNKPAWATFNTVTGELVGTPSLGNVGTYADIVITAADGKQSASLPAFTITVSDGSAKSVTLSWVAPTLNEDGTPLTKLAGFMIAYGPNATTLSQSIRIDNPSIDRYVIGDLAPGTYYFGVRAVDTEGTESSLSEVVSTVIQ